MQGLTDKLKFALVPEKTRYEHVTGQVACPGEPDALATMLRWFEGLCLARELSLMLGQNVRLPFLHELEAAELSSPEFIGAVGLWSLDIFYEPERFSYELGAIQRQIFRGNQENQSPLYPIESEFPSNRYPDVGVQLVLESNASNAHEGVAGDM
jgi:hypothetical protein